MSADMDIGMLVFVADAHFRAAPKRTIIAAWLLGRHQRFEHLGTRFRLAWWRDTPYLLTVKGEFG